MTDPTIRLNAALEGSYLSTRPEEVGWRAG